MENIETVENKGEFCDLNQIKRARNCAIRDFVAQLKMRWRILFGSFLNLNFLDT
jgi:hypothetical protein